MSNVDLIERGLGALVIILLVVLAMFLVRDLLPDSSVTIISNGPLEP